MTDLLPRKLNRGRVKLGQNLWQTDAICTITVKKYPLVERFITH